MRVVCIAFSFANISRYSKKISGYRSRLRPRSVSLFIVGLLPAGCGVVSSVEKLPGSIMFADRSADRSAERG